MTRGPRAFKLTHTLDWRVGGPQRRTMCGFPMGSDSCDQATPWHSPTCPECQVVVAEIRLRGGA